MTNTASFLHSTGWRVFTRTMVPVMLAIGFGHPESWLSGFDVWWHNFSGHYTHLHIPHLAFFRVPEYVFLIVALPIYGFALVRLWRSGSPWALAGAVCMTVLCWLFHITAAFAGFAYR